VKVDGKTTPSPEHHASPIVQQSPAAHMMVTSGAMPAMTQAHIGVQDPQLTGSVPPAGSPTQTLPLGPPPPHLQTTMTNPALVYGMPPEFVQLTVVDPFSNRKSALGAPDFMPNGEWSLASVYSILAEDLGFNATLQVLSYEGPHGRVWVTSDRNLRVAISWEAGRGVKYPKWEIERR